MGQAGDGEAFASLYGHRSPALHGRLRSGGEGDGVFVPDLGLGAVEEVQGKGEFSLCGLRSGVDDGL